MRTLTFVDELFFSLLIASLWFLHKLFVLSTICLPSSRLLALYFIVPIVYLDIAVLFVGPFI